MPRAIQPVFWRFETQVDPVDFAVQLSGNPDFITLSFGTFYEDGAIVNANFECRVYQLNSVPGPGPNTLITDPKSVVSGSTIRSYVVQCQGTHCLPWTFGSLMLLELAGANVSLTDLLICEGSIGGFNV